MPALSPTLVSILDACVRASATRADMSRSLGVVRLGRGIATLVQTELPAPAYDRIIGELMGLGARGGGEAPLRVQSPIGPLTLQVTIGPTAARLLFPRKADVADAEAVFAELIERMVRLRADVARCAAERASFERRGDVIAVAPLEKRTLELLVAHGRAIATFAPGESRGTAMLALSAGDPTPLYAEIADPGVVFSFRPF